MFMLAITAFAGPVDALLVLIEQGDLEPAGVSVATIVQQYALYRAADGASDGEAAEFIGLASRLMLLKSRALLPRPAPAPPPEEPTVDLAAVLAEYRRFQDAAAGLRAREDDGLRSFPRLAPPPAIPPGSGLSQVTLQRLAAIVRDLLARQEPPAAGVVTRELVTIRQKVAQLQMLLQGEAAVSFTAFIGASRSRLEVVVGFMAVLELIRRGRLQAIQPEPFGNILLKPLGATIAV